MIQKITIVMIAFLLSACFWHGPRHGGGGNEGGDGQQHGQGGQHQSGGQGHNNGHR